MANERGAGAVVANDGSVYSFVGNAQQNGLTPYRFDTVTTPQPGQVVYIGDLDTGEVDAPGFAPFQREDAHYEAIYEPGVATFRKTRGDLAIDYCVFVPPDFPGDVRLLTAAQSRRADIAPARDAVLRHRARRERQRTPRAFSKSEIVGDVMLLRKSAQ